MGVVRTLSGQYISNQLAELPKAAAHINSGNASESAHLLGVAHQKLQAEMGSHL